MLPSVVAHYCPYFRRVDLARWIMAIFGSSEGPESDSYGASCNTIGTFANYAETECRLILGLYQSNL